MKLENVIYEEQQKTYFIVVLVFIIVAVLLLAVVLSPNSFNKEPLPLHVKIILLIVTVIDLILFWSFSRLTIKITNKYVQLGFGIFKKKILLTQISDCIIEDYKKSVYFGYGIRFGRDKSIGYVARGGRGVRLLIKSHDYFFTSDAPEQIVQVLKQQLSQMRYIKHE